MAIMNIALLALLPLALARPQVGHGDGHKGFHGPHTAGTALPGPFGGNHHHHHQPPMATGTAPYPVAGGNSTLGAATGSSGAPTSTENGAPVYITSVINVIPTPIVSDVPNSGAASGTGGTGNPTGGPMGPGGSEAGNPTGGPVAPSGSAAGTECGPATVTVTSANTVTVTVTPAGASAAGSSGETGLPGAESATGGPGAASSLGPTILQSIYVPPVSSAPFPTGNSTAPAGTGIGTGVPTSQPAAAQTTSSSVLAAQPHQTPSSSYLSPAPIVPISSYVPPPVQASSSQAPQPPVPASSSQAYQPSVAQSSSAAPAPSHSSAPATSGAKGVAYNTPQQATQVSGLSWACNWGQEMAVSNPPFEYVPQLWGKKDGMTASIGASCAGAKACLFYNEPDMSLEVGGSGIDVNTAIEDFKTIMLPIQKAGSKVSTPCVANSDSLYMSTFLAAFPSGSIDIMCFHWYGPDLSGLKGTVATFKSLADQHGIKELWINEFAVQPAPSDLSSFSSYLDSAVTRYAYNMNDMAGSTGY